VPLSEQLPLIPSAKERSVPPAVRTWRKMLSAVTDTDGDVREGRAFRQHERLFLARPDRVRRKLGDVAAIHACDGMAAWR
jgi:hypothetical protein